MEFRVINRSIERVRHGADKLASGIARELSVCIQGDYITQLG